MIKNNKPLHIHKECAHCKPVMDAHLSVADNAPIMGTCVYSSTPMFLMRDRTDCPHFDLRSHE